MSDIKPVESIKTAEERQQDRLQREIDIHKAHGVGYTERPSFFGMELLPYLKEEAAELRAAYEALQKENAELKVEIQMARDTNEISSLANKKFIEESAAQAKRIEELEISAKRYEKLRRLNAYQFQNIFKTNITSYIRFDELVDNLPASKNGE